MSPSKKFRKQQAEKNKAASVSPDLTPIQHDVKTPKRVPMETILAWGGFYAILLTCIGYVLFHAFLIDSVTVRLCREVDGPNARPTEVLPVPLLEIAFDGYVWNRHAEHIGEAGDLRTHYV